MKYSTKKQRSKYIFQKFKKFFYNIYFQYQNDQQQYLQTKTYYKKQFIITFSFGYTFEIYIIVKFLVCINFNVFIV